MLFYEAHTIRWLHYYHSRSCYRLLSIREDLMVLFYEAHTIRWLHHYHSRSCYRLLSIREDLMVLFYEAHTITWLHHYHSRSFALLNHSFDVICTMFNSSFKKYCSSTRPFFFFFAFRRMAYKTLSLEL